MGRVNIGSPNKVLATEVLVVSENVPSWAWLSPRLGASRVDLFVLESVSWSYVWEWRESIKVIKFSDQARAIHTIGTDEWNYFLWIIQGGRNFVCNIVIRFSCARHELSILGVTTGRHSKISKDLLLHSEIHGFSVSFFLRCDFWGVTGPPCILIHNIK